MNKDALITKLKNIILGRDELIREKDEIINDLSTSLYELYATVRGECPSLLNEDSGGNAILDLDIINALSQLGYDMDGRK